MAEVLLALRAMVCIVFRYVRFGLHGDYLWGRRACANIFLVVQGAERQWKEAGMDRIDTSAGLGWRGVGSRSGRLE